MVFERHLNRPGCLGSALDHPEMVLLAIAVDGNAADQHDGLGHVRTVKLDYEEMSPPN